MSEQFRYFRLPFGGTTTNTEEYGRAWDNLENKFAEFFPGYVLSSHSPGVQFVTHDPTPYADRISLTLKAIEILFQTGERILKKQEKIKELEELLIKAVQVGIDGALNELRTRGVLDDLLEKARDRGMLTAEFYISISKKVIG